MNTNANSEKKLVAESPAQMICRGQTASHDSSDGRADSPLWVDVWFSPMDGAHRFSIGDLSGEERTRLHSIQSPEQRYQFGFSRTLLRSCLASYLDCGPSEVVIFSDEWGKPRVRSCPELHFNLSHTTGALVIAVSKVEVGVDVESRTLLHPLARLTRIFSPEEEAALRPLPEREQAQLFMKFWTRREALLKAIGRGFCKGVEIPVIPADLGPGYLLWVNHAHGWLLSDLRLPQSFYAALAIRCGTDQAVAVMLHSLPEIL